MSFKDLIIKRQSTRAYLAKKVGRELIETCLEAARLAPSACNSQPWSFIVIDEQPLKDRLSEAAFSGIYSLCSFARAAPVIIIVITERSSYATALGNYIKGTQYNLIDIGIVCEHIVLQATELGLGTCHIGWFNEKKIKRVLSLPHRIKIDLLISLGYPADDSIREKHRKPLDEIRSYNKQ